MLRKSVGLALVLAFAILRGGITAARPPSKAEINSGHFEASADEVAGVDGAYRLAACPSQQAPGGTVVVCWTAPACGTNSNDWIGLYAIGATSYQPGWFYTKGQVSGCHSHPAPATPGTYEFRYLLRGGYTDVARSAPITVCATCTAPLANCACEGSENCDDRNPCTDDACLNGVCQNLSNSGSPNYLLGACPDRVAPGGSILVCWTASGCRATNYFDWIDLYVIGAPNSPYRPGWFYTQARANGCRTYTAPTTPGTYEFRYLVRNGYVDVARSAPITVCSGCPAGPSGCCQLTPTCSTNADCDDGLFCNGAESCQHGCCVSGSACGTQCCNEDTNSCQPGVWCASDWQCNDNNPCTMDQCVSGCCKHTPPQCTSNLDCDDGLFCNGAEICLSGGCCVAGTPPCLGHGCCDEETHSCNADRCCDASADCDDGILCNGDEQCQGGCCVAGSPLCEPEQCCETDADCDDGIYCNGAETCQSNGCCQIGSPVCCPSQSCNEESHVCEIDPPCDCDCDCDCVLDEDDVCPCVIAPMGVDSFGRPLGDLDGDCDVDLDDFWILQGNFAGVVAPTCPDGACGLGENCSNCPQDCPCPFGQECKLCTCIDIPPCPDGVCEADENCSICAQDCPCPSGEQCQNGSCITAPTCPNSVCGPDENCLTCAQDCPCPSGSQCQGGICVQISTCSNGVCGPDENCSTCPQDCPCPSGLQCQSGICVQIPTCPNGVCGPDENCSTCPQDCPCPSGSQCQSGACVPIPTHSFAVCSSGTPEDSGICFCPSGYSSNVTQAYNSCTVTSDGGSCAAYACLGYGCPSYRFGSCCVCYPSPPAAHSVAICNTGTVDNNGTCNCSGFGSGSTTQVQGSGSCTVTSDTGSCTAYGCLGYGCSSSDFGSCCVCSP